MPLRGPKCSCDPRNLKTSDKHTFFFREGTDQNKNYNILTKLAVGRAVAQRLDFGFPPRRPGFAYGQHVGFVVDKATLGQFSPSTSVSPANHSTDFSIIIIIRG
jgi:hypothetical protein